MILNISSQNSIFQIFNTWEYTYKDILEAWINSLLYYWSDIFIWLLLWQENKGDNLMLSKNYMMMIAAGFCVKDDCVCIVVVTKKYLFIIHINIDFSLTATEGDNHTPCNLWIKELKRESKVKFSLKFFKYVVFTSAQWATFLTAHFSYFLHCACL